MSKAKHDQTQRLVEAIALVLDGVPTEIAGAALCELSAFLIAQHHPVMRGLLFELHTTMMEKMIPVMEMLVVQQQYGGVRPEGW